MKVNDYVRTKDCFDNQLISKIKEIYDDDFIETDKGYWDNEHIIKSSPNIIDLIETGDYVNEIRVTNISKEQGKNIEIYLDTDDLFEQTIYKNEDIKSIVTKEQFSQMEYKIGE